MVMLRLHNTLDWPIGESFDGKDVGVQIKFGRWGGVQIEIT